MMQKQLSPDVMPGDSCFFRRNVYEDKTYTLNQTVSSKKKSSSNLLSSAMQSSNASFALGQN